MEKLPQQLTFSAPLGGDAQASSSTASLVHAMEPWLNEVDAEGLMTSDTIKILYGENSQERILVSKYLLDKFSKTWREASAFFQVAHVTSGLGPKIYEVNWYSVMWKSNDRTHRIKQWSLTRVFVKWMLTGYVYVPPGTLTREDLLFAPFGCPEFVIAVQSLP